MKKGVKFGWKSTACESFASGRLSGVRYSTQSGILHKIKEINLSHTQQDLSPYSSHLLARRNSAIKKLDKELEVMLSRAMKVITDVVKLPRSVTGNAKVPGSIFSADLIKPWVIQPGMCSAACVYGEERPVTWLPTTADKDKLHHLLMVSVTKDGLMVLTTTDADHRAALLRHLQLDHFIGWKPVEQSVLVKAMIENEQLKTLWLAGIHRDTTVKPSSKILSGSDLRDAIDPMNDSSYLAGAARSSKGGVSLRNSSVWTGPNASLQAFEARTVELFTALGLAIKANPTTDLPVHSILATWVEDISKAKGCYFISHTDPQTLDGSSGKAKAKALTDQFTVELNAPGAPIGKPAWAFTALVTDIDSKLYAVIDVEPRLDGGTVSYDIVVMPTVPFDKWAKSVVESPALLKVYYDSGHTIAGSTLALARRQVSPFGGFVYGHFGSYDVTQEKPLVPTILKNGKMVNVGTVRIQDMMTRGDKSLFKWIFKEGLTLLKLAPPSSKKCWLYCDDGSYEVADFIHLDIASTPKRLTLFHAKGASSNKASRRTAPGPYELVASQAIKNLRAFDSKGLLARIKGRLKVNGANRIWDKSWQLNLAPMPDSRDFEAALEKLGTNYDCEVIIVQPHVCESDFTRRPKKVPVGISQLSTLLFGVESLARAVNAKFRVVADKI
jgi:hypothetical protein